MDYHKILEVGRNASVVQIKAAYRRLALIYHPDVNGGCPKKSAHFRQIATAYQGLIGNNQRFDSNSASTGPRYVHNPRAQVSREAEVDPAHFNVEMWKAHHYGDALFESQPSSAGWVLRWHNGSFYCEEEEPPSGTFGRVDPVYVTKAPPPAHTSSQLPPRESVSSTSKPSMPAGSESCTIQ